MITYDERGGEEGGKGMRGKRGREEREWELEIHTSLFLQFINFPNQLPHLNQPSQHNTIISFPFILFHFNQARYIYIDKKMSWQSRQEGHGLGNWVRFWMGWDEVV